MTPNRAVADPTLAADRLLDLYRRGIAGCRVRDSREVRHVVMELIGMLNFGYDEAARRLFEVYDDCLLQVERQRFDVPLRILDRLAATVASAPAVAVAAAQDRHAAG